MLEARSYSFGPFILDTARHLLLRSHEIVPLTPKTYDTLLLLIENRDRLLSKDELMITLWPDHSVDEANLTQQISTIRKALADGGSRDRYIVTVSGRGYRFAAPVSLVTEESQPPPPPASVEKPRSLWWKPALLLFIPAVAVALFVIAALPKQPKSLAVLPFQNLIQDPNVNYLGFSLADAIITKLDYVKALTVRPSYAVERYRNQALDLRGVARDLHVDTILTGSFIRDRDNLRITVQLIDVAPNKILWRDTFDIKFDGLFSIQDNVARQVIQGLALSLSRSEGELLKNDRPAVPVAYEYYLRGVDLYARNDFPTAIRMLEKSAEIDSRYALTWAQLGRAYTADASFQLGGRDEYRKAQNAYAKALSLQPAQIDAQIYMANFLTDTGHPQQAVPLLRSALLSNPNHAEAHWELGYAYRFAGMLKESVAESEKARQLDPTVKLTTSAPNAYLYLGDYDSFLNHLPNNDNSAFHVFYRGFAEYHKHNLEPALLAFDRAFELDPTLLHAAVGRALANSIRHEPAKGLELMRATEDKIQQRGVGDPEALYKLAQAYAVLGDKLSALRVLRHSVEGGFFPYPYLARDPLLEGIRTDPSFTQIIDMARARHDAFRRALF